ncbi:hypothetical protein CR513_61354, partial [Mucuna pruriens]
MCCIFPTSLKGLALSCYTTYPLKSIDSTTIQPQPRSRITLYVDGSQAYSSLDYLMTAFVENR